VRRHPPGDPRQALTKEATMRRSVLLGVFIAVVTGGVTGTARQAAVQQAEPPPTLEQLRRAVANLRGDRIKRPTSWDELTPQQQEYVKGILSGPRNDISGSLGVLIVSPELGEHAQRAIAYARFAGQPGYSTVPPKLSELAILMGARAWTAQYAWNAHERAGVRAGLPADVVAAIKVGKRPEKMERDVEAVYNFVEELLRTKQVGDATFAAARQVLGGDRGVVDLTATLGLYQTVAMLMVVDRMPLPAGVEPLKPLP
jgi:4-carboxymuconolactone decarboxylase